MLDHFIFDPDKLPPSFATIYETTPDLELVEKLLGMREPKPPKEKCAASRTVLVQTPTSYSWITPPCWTWKCPFCLPRLRWKWGFHLANKMLGKGLEFFIEDVPADKWTNAVRSIRRARMGKDGGLFVRVLDLVVSTAPIGFAENPKVNEWYSLKQVGKAIRDIDPNRRVKKSFRPVTTSWKWSLPKPPESKYKKVAALNGKVSTDSIMSAAQECGVTAKKRVWAVSFPSSTDQGDIDRMLALVQKRGV